MNDELKDLDLSSLSFKQFAEYFFARKVVPDNEQFDLFMVGLDGEKFDESVPVSPSAVVDHMNALFSNFGQVATKYTIEQVDQGIWAFGAKISDCMNSFLTGRSRSRTAWHAFGPCTTSMQISFHACKLSLAQT